MVCNGEGRLSAAGGKSNCNFAADGGIAGKIRARAAAWLLVYAFHGRAKPDIPPGATPSFCHRGARPMLWVLAGAGLVELVVLHVIAQAFLGPKVAWPLFALSEVGLIASATS